MDLKVINLKTLRRTHLSFLSLCVLILAASFLLFRMGFQAFPGSSWVIDLKNIFLYGMIGVAFAFSMFEASQRSKIRSLPTLEEKIKAYERFYRNRLWWHVMACATSGFLLLLTFRMLFFYICVFDLLMILLAWPAQFRIKREIGEEEIIFIN